MELTDRSMLEFILKSGKPAAHRIARPRRKKLVESKPSYETPVSKSVARRCNCGICPTCVDNARWERIFQEKFADPNYYDVPPRRGSSLAF